MKTSERKKRAAETGAEAEGDEVVSRWTMRMPVDHQCPEVEHFNESVMGNPITVYSGCGDEILEDVERRHLRECERCQDYGAANVEVVGR